MLIKVVIAKAWVVAVLTGFVAGAWGQADCPPPFAAPSQEQLQEGLKNAKDRGFLWRITKDGRSSFLYGTVHVNKLEWSFLGKQTTEALNSSDVVALELDFGNPQALQAARQAMQPSSIPQTTVRTKPIPADQIRRIEKMIEQSCLSPKVAQSMSPLSLASLLSLNALRRDGYEVFFGSELMLTKFAKTAKKTIVGLETVEEQMTAVTSSPSERGAVDIEQILTDFESGKSKIKITTAVNIWAHSDFEKLSAYSEWCECRRTPYEISRTKRVVDDRNFVMAERLDDLHNTGKNVFGAVGSLHMIGPVGLPKLMESKGYQVERIF